MLDNLVQGEYEVECLDCEVSLFIVLGEDGFFSCSDDYALRDVERTPLRPADPAELEGLAKQLHDRALADGQPVVALRLTYLFGRAACTDCGTVFSVADSVVANAIPDW
ncbi:hypothetical protein ABT095_37960 [Kitasatospora sp. NPDC002227]|uniref:hypothetical protein n=1 Tax=Kitasatospora sp. NPDC002227 TaxID=3154773 RepID=UPI00332B826E